VNIQFAIAHDGDAIAKNISFVHVVRTDNNG
jgi:hypothetical protein